MGQPGLDGGLAGRVLAGSGGEYLAEDDLIDLVGGDPGGALRRWAVLPPLSELVLGLSARREAMVLIRTDEAQGHPILVAGKHGHGRVLWCGAGDTWRWRRHGGSAFHERFLIHAVQWTMGLDQQASRPRELIDATADDQAMAAIAAAGEGRHATVADSEALIAAIQRETAPRDRAWNRSITLWDGWWTFALIAAALGAEWWLRRRWGV